MATRPSDQVLPRTFYARPTLSVAQDLVGKVLVHASSAGRTTGVIVEVEAYVGEADPACHAASGLTPRNAPLYGQPGLAYVYLNYGMHHLVNVVTESEGAPAAVLIRAVEPLEGLDLMGRRRGRAGRSTRALLPHELCRGPGNLSRAFGISRAQNRVDLTQGRLYIADQGRPTPSVAWSPRIGIRVGTDRPWRCFAKGSPSVSGLSRARL